MERLFPWAPTHEPKNYTELFGYQMISTLLNALNLAIYTAVVALVVKVVL